jgi:hypothetical protein
MVGISKMTVKGGGLRGVVCRILASSHASLKAAGTTAIWESRHPNNNDPSIVGFVITHGILLTSKRVAAT